MKMNKIRMMAGVLTGTMIIGCVGTAGIHVYAADSSDGKEEVIYIMTDASGKVENVNAVNIFGRGSVVDYGKYTSVKMLNTTDDISIDGDKVTFTTDKDKVYYQGTLENVEIPWNITFTYTLDGKKISPEDLAGKSGALCIHIQIEDNDKCTTDFYDSSALQINLTLDTEKCENISADGATLANVGADKQISYTVLPGKGLDAEVTADVKDFEMDAVAINGVKMNLNLDIDDDELMDKVTEIMDAVSELNDGAAALSDGTGELADGGKDLSDGTESMDDGIQSLDSGIGALSGGVSQMETALNTLNGQSGNLTSGSGDMLSALKTVQAELANVSVSTETLQTLVESSAAIKQGITDAYNGAVALQASLAYESYKNTLKSGGLDIDQLQAGNTQAIQNLSSQINELSASIAQLKSMPDYDTNKVYQGQVSQMESQIASLKNIITLLSGNNAAISGTEQYLNAASQGAADLVTGLETLKTNYEAFDSAIGSLVNSLSGLAVNVSQLKTGIDQLVAAYENLDTGIHDYTDGVGSIVSAYSQIVSGTSQLASGSKELVKGSKDLKSGASDLYNGIVTLDEGAAELSEGTQEFYEKTDGMDTKIEDTIDEMIDSISGGDSETVSFVSDKNTDVDSVQFVIKTAAIEKPDEEAQEVEETETKNFWEKLLALFGIDK